MSKKYIVTCSCSGTKEKAAKAFSLLFQNQELPEMHVGKDKIRALSNETAGTNFSEYLKAVVKKNGQYAYYFEVSDDGDIIDSYDLITGKRTA